MREKKNYDKWIIKLENDELIHKGISNKNANIVNNYTKDMHHGLNIAPRSNKGARSPIRLVNARSKLYNLIRLLERHKKVKDVTKLTEQEIMLFFADMRAGKIKRIRDNKPYKDVGSIVKVFKAFWNWHSRKSRKEGQKVQNITIDLDGTSEKPKWIYFSFKDFQKLIDFAKYEYSVLMWFLYDSGIRGGKELINVQVQDITFTKKETYLVIKDESSKTFGRRIKLMLCSNIIKKYIERENLKPNDYLFNIIPQVANRYLKNLGYKVLGIGKEIKKEYKRKGGWIEKRSEIFEGITMYDFRHNSACYWLPKYKSESALKYRFGWKKSDMIHYYTEFLGMKDTISENDLYEDDTKTKLENEIEELKKQLAIKEENEDERYKSLLKMVKKIVEQDIKK